MESAEELARLIKTQQIYAKSFTTDFVRKIKSYKTLIVNWIHNFKKSLQKKDDYFPLYFIWTTLRSCNFDCSYCDDHRGKKYPDLDNRGVLNTDEAKKLLKIMRTRTPAVYYSGGEPLMRNDLPELLKVARKLGYYPQVINTNGSLLHTRLLQPHWKEFLSDIDIIIVSLDSLNTSVLNEMYKINNSEVIIRNLLALKELSKEYKFKLMLNCVIQPDHLKDAHDVLDFANEHGIYFCGVPVNVGPRVSDGLIQRKDYQEFINKLFERHKQGKKFAGSFRLNEKLYTGAQLSCKNTLKPHVDYDGKLFWPCKAIVNQSPVMINILNYQNIDEIWKAGNEKIKATGFHGNANHQCGANCNWAQNYSTDSYDYGLKHPWSLVLEIFSFLKG